MSATRPTPTTDRPDHVSPQRAFDRLIWTNPEICNGCFERVKDVAELTISGGAVDHDVQEAARTDRATLERGDVEAAWERNPRPDTVTAEPQATGVDVARSGADYTIAVSVYGKRLSIRYDQAGDDHTTQRDELTNEFETDDDHPIAVDALAEGSGLADMLAERFPETIRFGAGNVAEDDTTYYSCWEEGLDLLGDWLADGGSIDDRKLYEELLIASRVVEFEERHYASRGTEVVCATASKDDVEERLGRSPDRLDAAFMAVWARDSSATAGIPTATARVGGAESGEEKQFRESPVGRAILEHQERQRGDPFR